MDAVAPRVVVVGSINVDLVVAGERLPAPGETVAGGTLTRSGGGKGANQAVAAARAGASVALVGAVGDDDLGAAALAELEAEGIDVRAVARLDDTATGVALIVVDSAGDNQIAVASGANHALDPTAVRAAVTASLRAGADTARRDSGAGSDTAREGAAARGDSGAAASGDSGAAAGGGVVLTGFELPDTVVLAAAEAATAAGALLVVNPAPARPLPEGLAAHGPILTPNEHEAAELTGERDVEAAARALVALTGAPVVVTLGARGALIAENGDVCIQEAPEAEVVDTTGAGDVFSGVLAFELARGESFLEAVEHGTVAASRSVTARGARGQSSDGASAA
jgi:ribokinase